MKQFKSATSLGLTCLVSVALAVGSCARDKAEADARKRSGSPSSPAETTPRAEPKSVAFLVNDSPVFEDELADQSHESIRTIVEAELVAQNARNADGFPIVAGESREEMARRFLENVFSEETLCRNIARKDYRALYEANYRPDWPADLYYGRLIEIRCAQPEDNLLHESVQTCLERHQGALEFLQSIQDEWSKNPDCLRPEWLERYPALSNTDFGYLDWVDLPGERQSRDPLFDPKTRRLIATLPLNVPSAPIASTLGYHMVKVTEFRPAISVDSPQFREKARERICSQRIKQTRGDFVGRLLKNARIESGTISVERFYPGRRPSVQIR